MSDSTFVTKGELDRYVSINSDAYVKDANKTNTGLSLIKGDNTSKVLDFITPNYNDSDTNKALNLGILKSLLGQGAIIASKLDRDNGYVKFANGFIVQWGITWFDSNKKYKDITVLTSFATDDSVSVETVGAECFITWNSGFSQSNKTTIRFLTNRIDTGSFVWLCIGKV